MNPDLSPILDAWPYEPGKINVRLIQGADGRPRIQVRVGLGILQMLTEGRPDGNPPEGFDSYLELLEARIDQAPDDENPTLSPDECSLLREEALLYYQRYVALLVLQDYEGVIRDTTRNLRVLDLLAHHAQSDADRTSLEPQRASLLTVRARALAGQAFQVEGQRAPALWAIDHAIAALSAARQDPHAPEPPELAALRAIRDTLEPRLPVSQRAELERRLQQAIEQENYRLAAILRDELRQLDDAVGT